MSTRKHTYSGKLLKLNYKRRGCFLFLGIIIRSSEKLNPNGRYKIKLKIPKQPWWGHWSHWMQLLWWLTCLLHYGSLQEAWRAVSYREPHPLCKCVADIIINPWETAFRKQIIQWLSLEKSLGIFLLLLMYT